MEAGGRRGGLRLPRSEWRLRRVRFSRPGVRQAALGTCRAADDRLCNLQRSNLRFADLQPCNLQAPSFVTCNVATCDSLICNPVTYRHLPRGGRPFPRRRARPAAAARHGPLHGQGPRRVERRLAADARGHARRPAAGVRHAAARRGSDPVDKPSHAACVVYVSCFLHAFDTAFVALSAALKHVAMQNESGSRRTIRSLACSGLGTYRGCSHAAEATVQMRAAYDQHRRAPRIRLEFRRGRPARPCGALNTGDGSAVGERP